MIFGDGLAFLVSGKGSLIDFGLPIRVVVGSLDCTAVRTARAAGLAAEVMERENFRGSGRFDDEAFTERLLCVLQRHRIGLVAMAGFQTILHKKAFEAFPGRIINCHLSVLPSFPTADPVRDAIRKGVHLTGFTVHRVMEETCGIEPGSVLRQVSVPVPPRMRGEETRDYVARVYTGISDLARECYAAIIREEMKRLLVD